MRGWTSRRCALICGFAVTVQMLFLEGGGEKSFSARCAGVHVDFHTHGDFNDFRRVPRHDFLLQVGDIDTCVSHHCVLASRAHLSTPVCRRNRDQGSRPERRLWRAAEPIRPLSNTSASCAHFRIIHRLWGERLPVEQTPLASPQCAIHVPRLTRKLAVRLNYDLPPIQVRRRCCHFVCDGRSSAASIVPRSES